VLEILGLWHGRQIRRDKPPAFFQSFGEIKHKERRRYDLSEFA
jgi:hypothetical protein